MCECVLLDFFSKLSGSLVNFSHFSFFSQVFCQISVNKVTCGATHCISADIVAVIRLEPREAPLFDIPFLFVKIEASAIERGANKIPRQTKWNKWGLRNFLFFRIFCELGKYITAI